MDAATLGVPKGWIVIGHNMSEESGMQEMADWLRPIVPEVKVQHVRAGSRVLGAEVEHRARPRRPLTIPFSFGVLRQRAARETSQRG